MPYCIKRSIRGLSRLTSENLEFESSWQSMEGLVRCSANYVPLTPISFLNRSAKIFGDRTSVIYGSVRYTWEETHARCLKLASALAQLGISRGDIVSSVVSHTHTNVWLFLALLAVGINAKLQ